MAHSTSNIKFDNIETDVDISNITNKMNLPNELVKSDLLLMNLEKQSDNGSKNDNDGDIDQFTSQSIKIE